MKSIFRNAMTLTALTVGMTCACIAQSATTQPSLTARVDPPATSDAGTDATHTSSAAAKPELQPTVAQEIEALKSRIDQLENEVKHRYCGSQGGRERVSCGKWERSAEFRDRCVTLFTRRNAFGGAWRIVFAAGGHSSGGGCYDYA